MEKKGSDSRKKVEESTTESVEKTPVVTVPPKEEGAVATQKETAIERRGIFDTLKAKSAMFVRERHRVHGEANGYQEMRALHFELFTEMP